MFNLILFGPPGAGKGTQSKIVAEHFGFLHLSTGELFRREIEKGSEIGLLVKSYIDRGMLVPDQVVMKELYRYALQHKDARGIIFDGFPRTLHQAEALDKVFCKKDMRIALVISIIVPEHELIQRILHRAEDSNRSDDNMDVILKRLEVYKEQTLPVIEYYKKTNRLVEVDGNRGISDVSQDIIRIVEEEIARRGQAL